MCANLTGDEEGKRIVGPEGEELGIIGTVEGGTAYVDPHSEIVDPVESKLGEDDADDKTYEFDEDDIESITDDEVQLERL